MSEALTPPEVLTPPEPLTPPKPVAPVQKATAADMVPLEPSVVPKLDAKVTEFVNAIINSPFNSEPFNEKLQAIHNLGSQDIRASAALSNRMLDKPVKALEGGLFDDKSFVAKSLTDLRKTVEDLDPSRQEDLLTPKRLFGLFGGSGDRLRDYFLKYQSSQQHINTIINTLYRSQDELRKDNAALEEEKVNLWNIMQRLQQYIYVGRQIDAAIEQRVTQIEQGDPHKARVVREEMLFFVRQKVQDLLTQLAVSIQGYLALDMIRKNNLELIKGVDRATTTTVSALRTAVIVAQALTNEKLVLDQINALNTTTGNLIASTSALLKKQTAQVYQQAADSSVSLEKLQVAFNNIYQTMDMISDYKLKSLDSMQKTVNALAGEVQKSQSYLDRVRSEVASEAAGTVTVPAQDDGVITI
ncbi:MAG: toxic anion resistance protein [Caldilineaceae bacterium]